MSVFKNNDSAMALIAHKIAPFQFDIGFASASASIRDQIVRAQLFIRAALEAGLLHKGQRINATHPLLICGAGVAGFAAAMEAERLDIYFILIDKHIPDPSVVGIDWGGALAGNGNRYVSPTMYEWPASLATEHAFPVKKPVFLASENTDANFKINLGKPVLIKDFAISVKKLVDKNCIDWLSAAKEGIITKSWFLPATKISLGTREALIATLKAGAEINSLPPVTFETARPVNRGAFSFSCILFASGFSDESTILCGEKIPTEPFWSLDKLLDPRLGTSHAHPDLLVVGGGDGAIQDAIRALIEPAAIPHPTALWEYLSTGPLPARRVAVIMRFKKDTSVIMTSDVLYRQILSIESYSSVAYAWVPNKKIYKEINDIYSKLAEQYIAYNPGVVRRLAVILRKDVASVTISTSNGFSRAYALNRFLIFLLIKARSCLGERYPIVEIKTNKVERFFPSSTVPTAGEVIFEGEPKKTFHHIVIRAGAELPVYQAIGITGINPARIELGRLPVPLMAPNTPAR